MKLVLFVLLLIVLATTAFGQDGRWQDGMVHIRYVEGVDVEAFSGALVAPGSRQALGIAAGAGWSGVSGAGGIGIPSGGTTSRSLLRVFAPVLLPKLHFLDFRNFSNKTAPVVALSAVFHYALKSMHRPSGSFQ